MKNVSAGLLLIAVTSSVMAAPHNSEQWIGSWASAQMIADQNSAAPSDLIRGGTLRQIVHLSAGPRSAYAFQIPLARPLCTSSLCT